MKIGIFSNQYQKKEIVEKIFTVLSENNAEIYVQKDFYDYPSFSKTIKEKAVGVFHPDEAPIDIALSIGGDGTFLRTVSFLQGKKVPILGVNTGRLGFLADITETDIDQTLCEILNREYMVEERTQIKLSINNKNDKYYYAFNEVAVLKQDLASMITVTMYINDELLSSYEADGLLVATPTGSTAYSLSVGGAIIAPDTPNFIVTAIAPHSLTSRPLVIGDNNILTMRVESRSKSFLISVDGRSKIFPVKDTELRIEKAEEPVYVVKRLGHTFYETLRNKLKWGIDPRQDSKM